MTFKSVNEKTATIYRFKNKSEVYYINSIELNSIENWRYLHQIHVIISISYLILLNWIFDKYMVI